MNIFILDENLKTAATYHTDKHCVKMLLEYCQMLCTAVSVNDDLQVRLNIVAIPYKKTHLNHPCTVWVCKSYDNFAWLVAYTHALHEEYKYRYNNQHLSYIKLKAANIINNEIIKYGSKLDITKLNPVCVMPDECVVDSVIVSYRNYYRLYKSSLFKWTKRAAPSWISTNSEVEEPLQ